MIVRDGHLSGDAAGAGAAQKAVEAPEAIAAEPDSLAATTASNRDETEAACQSTIVTAEWHRYGKHRIYVNTARLLNVLAESTSLPARFMSSPVRTSKPSRALNTASRQPKPTTRQTP